MYTTCSNCKTVFAITPEHLRAAEGMVRCGQCQAAFDANETLSNELPEALEIKEPIHSTPASGNGVDKKPAEPHQPPIGFVSETLTTKQSPDEKAPPANPVNSAKVPSVLVEDLRNEITACEGGRLTLAWTAGSLLMILVLASQIAHHQSHQIAIEYVTLRPLLEQFCALTKCKVAQRRDLEKIQVLNRDIYSHPSADNALLISVTMVNTATFSQPFPLLSVSMTDVRGIPVVRRHFDPQQYLPTADITAGMSPDLPYAIVLEVTDPGDKALNFELDFL